MNNQIHVTVNINTLEEQRIVYNQYEAMIAEARKENKLIEIIQLSNQQIDTLHAKNKELL